MLTKSLKISDTTKTEFYQLKIFYSDEKNDKTAAVQISAVFQTLLHVDCT